MYTQGQGRSVPFVLLAGPTFQYWQYLDGTHDSAWIRAAQSFRSGREKRGNLESCGGKNVRARLGPRTSSFRSARTDKWK